MVPNSIRLAASRRTLLVHRDIDNMAGCNTDGQPPCKKRMGNSTTDRLLDISMDMESKVRDELLHLDKDMRRSSKLHTDMLHHLSRLGDKLKKTQDAAKKIQAMIRNKTDEIEKCKNELDDMLADRRKLAKRSTYYKFCNRLLDNEPENSALWYFTGTECPVCLEKYKDMAKLNHCQHLLCVKCLTSMFETSHLCPLCRIEAIGYDYFDRAFLRTEYVTVTQHHARISNDIDTSRVLDGTESVPHPPADGGEPGLQLRNDMYGWF